MSPRRLMSARWKLFRESLRSFTGQAISMSLAAPLARCHARELRHTIGGRRCGKARLSHASMRSLRLWAKITHSSEVGRAIWQRASARHAHSDASPHGWGGGMQDLAPASRFFSAETTRLHIKAKEMRAITMNLQSICHLAPRALELKG